jgi:transcriptional regulator with XRE-family HTH domain
MELHRVFGQILKKWRRARGFTQGELAALSKLDRTFISLMERGERQPSLLTLFALAKPLKVSPAELVRQTENMIKKGRSPRQVRSASRRL